MKTKTHQKQKKTRWGKIRTDFPGCQINNYTFPFPIWRRGFTQHSLTLLLHILIAVSWAHFSIFYRSFAEAPSNRVAFAFPSPGAPKESILGATSLMAQSFGRRRQVDRYDGNLVIVIPITYSISILRLELFQLAPYFIKNAFVTPAFRSNRIRPNHFHR